MEKPRTFIKNPIVIEAVQWTGKNLNAIRRFSQKSSTSPPEFFKGELCIHTLEGRLHASPGDWIIKGIKGELYPCKPDVFDETYSPF